MAKAMSILASVLLFAMSGTAASVWKVTGPNGGTLYLGGSVHALRPTDYPLPAAYNQAFDASSRIVFEDDPKDSPGLSRDIFGEGRYHKGDSLKNHVDPRTYDYLRRFFALHHVTESQFSRCRPWFIAMMLEMPPPQLYNLGVEGFLGRRAAKNGKPVSGLESRREHGEVFTALNDHDSEEYLLLLFVQAGTANANHGDDMMQAWRRGDADVMARSAREEFSDFPSFAERLLGARNRRWIPKIEGYLRSGKTYFVVVGAAHMGGPEGLLTVLRARGYTVEML